MSEIEKTDQVVTRIVMIAEPASCYGEQFDAIERVIEADRAAVANAVLDEIATAMDGFFKRNPEHAWTQQLPLTIRELRAKYAPKAGEHGPWIPCSERLPRDGELVWFTCLQADPELVRLGTFDDDGGGYWNEDYGSWHSLAVGHWMPRYVQPKPEPPKLGGEPVVESTP